MAKINNDTYVKDMRKLETFYGTIKTKMMRNLRKYEYTPGLSLENLTDENCVGYYQNNGSELEADTTAPIQENIIRSCISTLVSKIASQKVRPFFNTVNGSFKDMQIVKAAQQFFDLYFTEIDVNKVVSNAFRDACIFDRGYIFINSETKMIERVMPWQLFIDPRENSYNKLTRVARKQMQFPTSLLSDSIKTELEYVTYWQYWNIRKHKYVEYIPEVEYYKEHNYDSELLPFVILNYESPVKGTSCSSVVDLLYGIQKELDYLNTCIKDATQRSNIKRYFVPEMSNVKVSKLSNRAGEMVTYTPIQGVTNPIIPDASPVMDNQWLELVKQYKQDAYELVGISQLSATSQKPKGLNSGVALDTMESIESDRFETQLNQVIRAYVDIAKACLHLFDPNDSVLPPTIWRKQITWGDIVNSSAKLCIQFSAAEFLSNDPSIKIQQVQALVNSGYISRQRAASLMEIPDLQQGYSLANNALNAVLAVIDDCIERDIYDIPIYIPTKLLLEEIANTCLSLRAASNDENDIAIQKLMELYKIAERMQQDAQTSAEMAASVGLATELQNQIQSGNLQQAFNQQVGNMNAQQAGEADITNVAADDYTV